MSKPLLDAAQTKYSPAQIAPRREAIRHHVLSHSPTIRQANFTAICIDDLRQLFDAYDRAFFHSGFQKQFEDLSCRLTFRLSKRMTQVGGMTSYERVSDTRQFEIAISTALLFSNWREGDGGAPVGGLPTTSRLDALQRVLEHELIHLLELCLWEDSRCGGTRFKSIVRRLFGHRESNHQLVSPEEFVRRQFGFHIGDAVQFEFRGRMWRGWVNGVLQRVTVLVEHARGERYRDGKRYLRFYVPPEDLTPVEDCGPAAKASRR